MVNKTKPRSFKTIALRILQICMIAIAFSFISRPVDAHAEQFMLKELNGEGELSGYYLDPNVYSHVELRIGFSSTADEDSAEVDAWVGSNHFCSTGKNYHSDSWEKLSIHEGVDITSSCKGNLKVVTDTHGGKVKVQIWLTSKNSHVADKQDLKYSFVQTRDNGPGNTGTKVSDSITCDSSYNYVYIECQGEDGGSEDGDEGYLKITGSISKTIFNLDEEAFDDSKLYLSMPSSGSFKVETHAEDHYKTHVKVYFVRQMDAHTHTWNSGKVTTAATCTKKGVKTYTCTICSATKTEDIPKTAHTKNSGTVTTPATCTTSGVKSYKCSKCGTAMGTETIPALKHDFSGAWTYFNPVITWASTGYTADWTQQGTQKCTRCSTQSEVKNAGSGHATVTCEITQWPTFDANGVRTYTAKATGYGSKTAQSTKAQSLTAFKATGISGISPEYNKNKTTTYTVNANIDSTAQTKTYKWEMFYNGSWVAVTNKTGLTFSAGNSPTLGLTATAYDAKLTKIRCTVTVDCKDPKNTSKTNKVTKSSEAAVTWSTSGISSFKPVFTGNLTDQNIV